MSPTSKLNATTRAVCAGVGAVCAGPLGGVFGAAMGEWIGPALADYLGEAFKTAGELSVGEHLKDRLRATLKDEGGIEGAARLRVCSTEVLIQILEDGEFRTAVLSHRVFRSVTSVRERTFDRLVKDGLLLLRRLVAVQNSAALQAMFAAQDRWIAEFLNEKAPEREFAMVCENVFRQGLDILTGEHAWLAVSGASDEVLQAIASELNARYRGHFFRYLEKPEAQRALHSFLLLAVRTLHQQSQALGLRVEAVEQLTRRQGSEIAQLLRLTDRVSRVEEKIDALAGALVEHIEVFPEQKQWLQRLGWRSFPTQAHSDDTLRAFVAGAEQPYYSRRSHLQIAPHVDTLDEAGLLRELQDCDGLIITGGSGMGKTRLARELARMAQDGGWTVLESPRSPMPEHLTAVASALKGERVLMLFDYLEKQQGFDRVAERIAELRDAEGEFRYIATCRSSYYPAVRDIERHRHVDLTPASPEEAAWEQGYRDACVRSLLEQGGIEPDELHVAVCNRLPVFAVFLVYLRAHGRYEELGRLVGENGFARWLSGRLGRSLPHENLAVVQRVLARLFPLLPLPAAAFDALDDKERHLLLELSKDGWVGLSEGSDEPENAREWRIVHSIVADQCLILELGSYPPELAEVFIAETFRRAVPFECLTNAFRAFQRICHDPAVSRLKWDVIIRKFLRGDPANWSALRFLLLRTPLLSPERRVELLRDFPEVWSEAVNSIEFQNVLGSLMEHCLVVPPPAQAEMRRVLLEWSERVSNQSFAIKWGLRLAPQQFEPRALAWLADRPLTVQSDLTLVAWLEAGLAPEKIEKFVRRWCACFSTYGGIEEVVGAWLRASRRRNCLLQGLGTALGQPPRWHTWRTIQAWCVAGGSAASILERIQGWLEEFGSLPNAGSLLIWLLEKARVPPGQLEAPLRKWLDRNLASYHAQFLLTAWVEAGGSPQVIERDIAAWLEQHAIKLIGPSHVIPVWLERGGALEAVRPGLRLWLNRYRLEREEASFVLSRWLRRAAALEPAACAVEAALVREDVAAWIGKHGAAAEASYVYEAWLEADGDVHVVSEWLPAWAKTQTGALLGLSYVLPAFFRALKRGRNKDLPAAAHEVEPHLIRWLENFLRAQPVETSRMIGHWLEISDFSGPSVQAALDWLQNHAGGEHIDAMALFSSRIVFAEKPAPALVAAILEKFSALPPSEKALPILARIGLLREEARLKPTKTSRSDYERALFQAVEADRLYPLLLRAAQATVARGPKAVFDDHWSVVSGLAVLAGSVKIAPALQGEVDRLLLEWLRTPGSFTVPIPMNSRGEPLRLSFHLVSRYCVVLHAEYGADDDLLADAPHVRRFLTWLASCHAKDKVWFQSDLADFAERFPLAAQWWPSRPTTEFAS